MKFLVTGGNGFIGSEVVKQLLKSKHEVRVLDNLIKKDLSVVHPDAINRTFDVSAEEYSPLIQAFIKECDVIIHLAGVSNPNQSIQWISDYNRINTNGTLNILARANSLYLEKVVIASGYGVYGNARMLPAPENRQLKPESPYACQEVLKENYAKMFSKVYGMRTVCLRYFNVFGDGCSPIPYRGKNNERKDFIHVKDAARATIKAAMAKNLNRFEVFNIGSGKPISIQEAQENLIDKENFYQSHIEAYATQADISKARTKLKWSPTHTNNILRQI